MTNRDWIEKMNNYSLAETFCSEIAKDGDYCENRCPFAKLCVGGANGFEIWLGKERRNENA